MFNTKTAAALVLWGAIVLPTVAFAAPGDSPVRCILQEHRLTKVEALHVTERYGRGTSERLVGAQVFVQAEPGLTAEWLQLTLQRHMTQMRGGKMADCALDAKDVRVSVQSAGPGFAVKITGKNATQAKEILRRAKLLVG